MPVINAKALVANRVKAIRDYHQSCGIKRAELDVSGGIDSAVMAGLLVLALGAENCTFAHLGIHSNPVQTDRAERLIAGLGAKLAILDVTEEYTQIVNKIQAALLAAGYDIFEIEKRIAKDPTILGSIRSTLRAPLGRAFNRITGGGIRHGTGNECEDRWVRFFQKGGDGEVDTNPIAMLSKAEVYQSAYELATGGYFDKATDLGLITRVDCNVEVRKAFFDTIGAIPSADLWGNGDKHNDESEIRNWLGADFTYGRLDVATGKVVSIGTIERVSRFLDETFATGPGGDRVPYESLLFDGVEVNWQFITDRAVTSLSFGGSNLTPDQIEALLRGAHKAERQTRHKMNPNCPQLGDRQELLIKGILSDNFADYGIPAK